MVIVLSFLGREYFCYFRNYRKSYMHVFSGGIFFSPVWFWLVWATEGPQFESFRSQKSRHPVLDTGSRFVRPNRGRTHRSGAPCQARGDVGLWKHRPRLPRIHFAKVKQAIPHFPASFFTSAKYLRPIRNDRSFSSNACHTPPPSWRRPVIRLRRTIWLRWMRWKCVGFNRCSKVEIV